MLELSTTFFRFFKQSQTFDMGAETFRHGKRQIEGVGVLSVETLNREFADGFFADLQRHDGRIFFGLFIPIDGADFLEIVVITEVIVCIGLRVFLPAFTSEAAGGFFSLDTEAFSGFKQTQIFDLLRNLMRDDIDQFRGTGIGIFVTGFDDEGTDLFAQNLYGRSQGFAVIGRLHFVSIVQTA